MPAFHVHIDESISATVKVEAATLEEAQCMEVSAGDYMFIPFAPCYLSSAPEEPTP